MLQWEVVYVAKIIWLLERMDKSPRASKTLPADKRLLRLLGKKAWGTKKSKPF